MVEKLGMIDRVEGFTEVGRGHDGAGRRFPLVEAPCDLVGQRVKGGDGGVARGEAVLVRGAGEVGKDEGTHKTLKNLGGGAKEGDGPIRNTLSRGFIGFQDRENKGGFPDSREGGMGGREVEERSEEREGKGAEVFKVDTGETVG